MALVLNAVAGARRSQRNNARASDVNQVAAGVNQYIAIRNELPATWSTMSRIVDDGEKFGHFESDSINPQFGWIATHPANNGDFTALGTATGELAPTAVLTTQPTTQPVCVRTGGTWAASACTGATGTNPLTTGSGIGGSTPAAADQIIVFRKAACVGTTQITQGGIREMAIVYKLEGQDNPICLEI